MTSSASVGVFQNSNMASGTNHRIFDKFKNISNSSDGTLASAVTSLSSRPKENTIKDDSINNQKIHGKNTKIYTRPGVKKAKNANFRDMVNYDALRNCEYEIHPNYDNKNGRGNRKFI